MRFLPLPNRAYRWAAVFTLLILGWILWGSFTMPESLWAPGHLSKHHQNLRSCLACHQPFIGVISDKCGGCHSYNFFSDRSKTAVKELHRSWLREGKTCLGCHIEHEGRFAPITVGALVNPHGEFVFHATGAKSCKACHNFSDQSKSPSYLLSNIIVKQLLHEGEGAHKPGKMGNCCRCHQDDE